MGIVPIWGLQMIIAIAISILFKLNKALVLIAANISILPLIPFILYFSHLTGSIWMGKDAKYITLSRELTLSFFWNNGLQYLWQYVLGAITLATVSGLFFGFITFILLKFFKRNKDVKVIS